MRQLYFVLMFLNFQETILQYMLKCVVDFWPLTLHFSRLNLYGIERGIVDSLGSMANTHCNFDGQMLNAKNIRSPTTHLVSAHHMTSPDSAGYISSEVLTTVQSALISLRILALHILCAILSCHEAVMFKPLLKSGTSILEYARFLCFIFLCFSLKLDC